MASSRRSARHSVSQRLHAEPFRFSFVQAVRLTERIAKSEGERQGVGFDVLPAQECVKFTGYAARSFPATEVVDLTSTNGEETRAGTRELTVAFMGLFGPSGVLPYHDTQRIIDGGSKKNPERDFLDVFNHRVISLFYRASTKYRVPFIYEETYRSTPPAEDVVTRALYALAGMGTVGLRGRLECRDELAIEFSGMLGHHPKNAVALSRVLEFYFGLPIAIEQFVGQWLTLAQDSKSEMPSRRMPLGQNCILGESFVVGDRLWDISGKFRVAIGPLRRSQFESFLPGSQNLVELAQLVQLYAGNQFDFDIQLELLAEEIPETQLGEHSRLGLNTWLLTGRSPENRKDTVFTQSGRPLENKPLENKLGSAA